jgi:integrase
MVAGLLVATMGRGTPVSVLRQEDFAKLRQQMTKRWGAISVGNHIQVVRSIFKYGFDAELLDKPVRFGPGFKKPSAKTIRQARACRGPRLFTSQEVHKLLDGTTFILRAMILLGVNGGLGNTDLALLPINAIDWLAGWLDYPRMKTGILRRIPLWSETLEALRAVKDRRRPPRKGEDSGLLFVGRNGVDYVGNHKGYRVTAEFNRGCRKTGVVGRTFYDLRRTFQTVGEEGGDLVAVRAIMGHAPVSSDMSAVYRQRVSDDRLLAVANYVHKWLFGVEESKMNNVHRVGG